MDIHPNSILAHVYLATCTHIFLLVLFIKAKIWKKLKCSFTGKWINKLWYIDYYTEVKMNELGLYTATKMDLRISVE